MAEPNTKISQYHDIREFVSPVVWKKWGNKSKWFVQARIVNVCELLRRKTAAIHEVPVSNVIVKINTWHTDNPKETVSDAGYRSGLDFLNNEGKPLADIDIGDYDSFHWQGHCANATVEVVKDDNVVYLSSYGIATVILSFEDDFILNGLTAISEPRKSHTSLHMDCRNTGSFGIKIMNTRR